MGLFQYKAMDDAGKRTEGSIEADTADQAGERLVSKGLMPVSIKAVAAAKAAGAGQNKAKGKKVRPDDLIFFTTQLAAMLRAGIPILRSMEILGSETGNRRLRTVCEDVVKDIGGGAPLNKALARHKDVFNLLYRNMVAAGEASGNLHQVLERLVYIIGHEHKVRKDIKSALQYPIMVVVALTGAMAFLLTTVVPTFEQLFRDAGIDLPAPTLACIAMSNFLRGQWIWLIALVTALGAGIFVARRLPTGAYWMSKTALEMPYLGALQIKAALSRFAGIFSILQASGVGILESIDILSGTLGNKAMTHEFEKIKEQVAQGHGLSRPLAQANYFSPMFVSMVSIGEETGKLDEMLRDIAAHYDMEVEFAAKRLTGIIGPVLIVGLAAVVGFFALAVYMPMWDIAQLATKGG